METNFFKLTRSVSRKEIYFSIRCYRKSQCFCFFPDYICFDSVRALNIDRRSSRYKKKDRKFVFAYWSSNIYHFIKQIYEEFEFPKFFIKH